MAKGGQQRSKKRAAELAAQRARKAAAESGRGAADAAALFHEVDDETDAAVSEPEYERTPEVVEFWEGAGIEPVEIALPGGVGFTLRHYRMETFYPEPDVEGETDEPNEDDDFDFPETVRVPDDDDEQEDETDEPEARDEKTKPAGEAEDDESEADRDNDKSDEEGKEREVVVMLTKDGRLQLFKTASGLAAFIASKATHDLADIEAFAQVKANIKPELIAPAPEDRYELDLVVRNLRGGRDAWDPDLLISAGEIARDIAYACDLTDTLEALSAGSPVDALDDALRGSGFWSRWKLRRIKAEQVTLAWRGAIGKIVGAVEWHK